MMGSEYNSLEYASSMRLRYILGPKDGFCQLFKSNSTLLYVSYVNKDVFEFKVCKQANTLYNTIYRILIDVYTSYILCH